MSSSPQDLLTSALHFLQDPTVATAPISRKIAFLKQKGLSEIDVDTVLAMSEEAKNKIIKEGKKHWILYIAMGLGIGLGGKWIWEWWNENGEEKDKLATMKQVEKISDQNIQHMGTMERKLEKQATALNELLAEMKSLKALSLNRKMFPPAPSSMSEGTDAKSASKGLPTWQLEPTGTISGLSTPIESVTSPTTKQVESDAQKPKSP